MDLYARVNILGGRAVRLPHGDVTEAISLDADPVDRAEGWVEKGADHLHIVDLDAAAYRDYRNRPLIHELIDTITVPVQVAGGVRSQTEAERLLEAGAWRVVMGTAAIEDQNLVYDICRDFPGQVAVSLDVLVTEELVVRGWTAHSGRYLEEVLIEMSSVGAAAFMIVEAGRDALAEPPLFGLIEDAVKAVDEPVIAAGGVRNVEDLRALKALEVDGKRLGGVVVGREVTEGRFTFDEAAKLLAE